jgi:hypothetical protein
MSFMLFTLPIASASTLQILLVNKGKCEIFTALFLYLKLTKSIRHSQHTARESFLSGPQSPKFCF